MDILAALAALTPEDLRRVAEILAPSIALIPSRCTTLEYRGDGCQLVQFEMKIAGEWRYLGTYTTTYGISRTWIDPEPQCDLSGACAARRHYEDCASARGRHGTLAVEPHSTA
jgi:hypothetical protein